MKPFNIIFNETNGYMKEHNGAKYLTLIHANKKKDALQQYKEIWNKIEYLIKLRNKKFRRLWKKKNEN